MSTRYDWTIEELKELYAMPLLKLIAKANLLHNQLHEPAEVQVCSLISIKTGGCPEDCKYCAQSSRYQTSVSVQPMMQYEAVLNEAKKAAERGATRVCLGAAWREVRDSKQFEEVLQMVKGITDLGVEVCCTLGRLKERQAERLKEAGLYAYNHNLDSSERFYKKIITTRTYDERLNTIENVRKAGITVCCGGIIGMGESASDRIKLLVTLSSLETHPESVPINALVPVKGTPLGNKYMVSIWEMARMVATARIVLPKSVVRLSAGRMQLWI